MSSSQQDLFEYENPDGGWYLDRIGAVISQVVLMIPHPVLLIGVYGSKVMMVLEITAALVRFSRKVGVVRGIHFTSSRRRCSTHTILVVMLTYRRFWPRLRINSTLN